MTQDVAVVICTHDDRRWRDLEQAVASVTSQKAPPRDVIVVVDHNDALLARARARWPEALVTANSEAPGLSGSRNSGVAHARAPFVAFLDDDAVATPSWLAELRAGYRSRSVIAVGGSVVPQWPDRRPEWFPSEYDWVVGCSHAGMPTADAPVRNLVGANMSFRRDALLSVGGFRHELGRVASIPLGCEETELCIRAQLQLRDSIVLYRPSARVIHRVAPSRTSWRYFFARCHAEGVSKAVVSRAVGGARGLSSERRYVATTLPLGLAHGVADAIRTGNPRHLGRIVSISGGLAVTAAGYLTTMVSGPRRRELAA
jgi:GT2 family glycosyltransferase